MGVARGCVHDTNGGLCNPPPLPAGAQHCITLLPGVMPAGKAWKRLCLEEGAGGQRGRKEMG